MDLLLLELKMMLTVFLRQEDRIRATSPLMQVINEGNILVILRTRRAHFLSFIAQTFQLSFFGPEL